MKDVRRALCLNLKNILSFEICFRVIAIPLYIKLMSESLKLALKRANYSYVTANNILLFLTKPWTIILLTLLVILGIFLLVLEQAVLMTAFQGMAYYRKLTAAEMFSGGLYKVKDECRKANWKLFLLLALNYLLTQFALIYRTMTHKRQINFVISEIIKTPITRLLLILFLVISILLIVPAMYTGHFCMIEQKNFRDGMIHSENMVKKHRCRDVFHLVVGNLCVLAATAAVYAVCAAITSACVQYFSRPELADIVYRSSCDKIETVLIGIAGIATVIVNMAALTVQYYQHGVSMDSNENWGFEYQFSRPERRPFVIGIVSMVLAVSIILIFDMVRNGSNLAGELLIETQITAHRGSSKSAPENTIAALEAAIYELSDFAEIDVQETKDGIVVLCHDTTLKRFTGAPVKVSSVTYEELEKMSAGEWFSQEFADEKFPTLEEVMELCKGRINLNIEIKNIGAKSEIVKKVMDLVENYDMQEQCVITSVNMSYLIQAKEINPDIHTGHIISAAYGDYYSNENIDFISLRSNFVNKQLVDSAHEAGKAVHAWTVNSREEIERVCLLGVDNIITDYPVRVKKIIDEVRGDDEISLSIYGGS